MSCGHEKIEIHQFQFITASKLVIHDKFSHKEEFMEEKYINKITRTKLSPLEILGQHSTKLASTSDL